MGTRRAVRTVQVVQLVVSVRQEALRAINHLVERERMQSLSRCREDKGPVPVLSACDHYLLSAISQAFGKYAEVALGAMSPCRRARSTATTCTSCCARSCCATTGRRCQLWSAPCSTSRYDTVSRTLQPPHYCFVFTSACVPHPAAAT